MPRIQNARALLCHAIPQDAMRWKLESGYISSGKTIQKKIEIFALPYGRYVFMMRKSGDYFTIFIFVFVMVMYNISMLVLYLVLLFTGPNFGTDCIRLYFSINLQCDLTYIHTIFIQNTILLSILSNLFDVFQAKILLKFNWNLGIA